MSISISETLAETVNRISYSDFPAILPTAANSAVEDTIAVAIAGAASECVDTALLALNPSAGPSTL
jgi:2-methylcitrate dehydratase PrpD